MIVPGQRWVSDSEPEMGLGMVLKVAETTLDVVFPAAKETRCYAIESAPLRRVIFKAGDYVHTHEGIEYKVTGVREEAGILTYLTDQKEIPEAALDDHMSFCAPQDRLFGCQVDDEKVFKLRVEALYRNYHLRKSPLRGYVGGRTDLIPHQMSIVSEMAERLQPRALLADEVGLGKTIEACMIMQRLHLTGRADRVLILLPEPLINQWFVELLRRFNMLFSIFDEERCAAIEANDEEANPFLDSQLVIANVDFLAGDENRLNQALEAGWDLMIVDEAHHLEWSEEEVSAAYWAIEQLAAQISGVLLLTATPQQLGPEGHFARLRLLDPDRFQCLETFLAEAPRYEMVAELVERLQAGKSLRKADVKWISQNAQALAELAAEVAGGDEAQRDALTKKLLDSCGTGRVMYRNTRANLDGFPERQAHLVPLPEEDVEGKLDWLADFMKERGDEKVLLICKTQETVEMISEAIQDRMQINVAVFHEELSLIQRDRNAAYFAEEDGAQLLVCSEIGSEGRNFQFAHHLVLFDLPYDPELLEQRIGRLDRIGQTETIHIHVPYLEQTYEEVLALWYHDGLNAFEENLHGATDIYRHCEWHLNTLWNEYSEETVQELIAHAQEIKASITESLASGYDKLLQMNTCHQEVADKMIADIDAMDNDAAFEAFLLRLMDHFGLHVEELDDRTYFLKPGNVVTDAFPHIPDEGLSVTFDRARALSREDIGFISLDHPIARACFDLLLGSESGNSCYGIWKTSGEKAVMLEAYQVIEVAAPASLHVDRFLPQTPIRVVVDHTGKNYTKEKSLLTAKLGRGGLRKLMEKPVMKQQLIPSMLDKCQDLAKPQMETVIAKSVEIMRKKMDAEIKRMQELAEVNDLVGDKEVQALVDHRDALAEAMGNARLRFDTVRLIWKEA